MERLHKVLAHAGIASRRAAEEIILKGRVRVNGRAVKELGAHVDPAHDKIEVDGQPIRAETNSYVILHKPRGYLSDRDEGQSRPTALDLVPSGQRLYAAGRLDANSEGLLLLTNDGDLAYKITHPRFRHQKEYLALVQGVPTSEDLKEMLRGVEYDGVSYRADSVTLVSHPGEQGRKQNWPAARKDETWLRIVLHEGKKREIRHMSAAVGHPVKRLIRVRIGPIRLGSLPSGQWRELSMREVQSLSESLRTK